MRNVLVTGGTGFIGSNLVFELLNEGCTVRVLRRRTSDLRALGDADVEHVIGDLRDAASVRRALEGCDTVFHTAAMVSYWRKEREEMYEVNIGGTRTIVELCLELGVERLVHTSSIAAVGFAEDGNPASESNEFNWERFDIGYRISKHRAEDEVRQGVKRGLDAVIVNPSIVIGPRDIHFHGGQLIRDIHKKRIFYYINGGMNVVYVDDVVRGHILAARQGRRGERYILCGENLTHSEIVGGFRPFFRVPAGAVQTIAATAETIGNILNVKPWVTRELLAGSGMTYFFSCDKARRELGYEMMPFREAVRRTYIWYKEQGLL